jgi:hypothetical protein
VERACIDKLGIPAASVNRVLAAARRKITLAADYARDQEIGKALARYNNLYERAVAMQDVKSALAAAKETCRLLGLNRKPEVNIAKDAGDGDEAARIRLCEDHLHPLGLAPREHPLEEHARLAAQAIRKAGLFPGSGKAPDVTHPPGDPGRTPATKTHN